MHLKIDMGTFIEAYDQRIINMYSIPNRFVLHFWSKLNLSYDPFLTCLLYSDAAATAWPLLYPMTKFWLLNSWRSPSDKGTFVSWIQGKPPALLWVYVDPHTLYHRCTGPWKWIRTWKEVTIWQVHCCQTQSPPGPNLPILCTITSLF